MPDASTQTLCNLNCSCLLGVQSRIYNPTNSLGSGTTSSRVLTRNSSSDDGSTVSVSVHSPSMVGGSDDDDVSVVPPSIFDDDQESQILFRFDHDSGYSSTIPLERQRILELLNVDTETQRRIYDFLLDIEPPSPE